MPLISCAEALRLLHEKASTLAPPIDVQRIPLSRTLGRVLAAPLAADRDQPPFDRSTRDGYALPARSAEVSLRLAGAIRAGEQWTGPALRPGETLEIMTGAPVPAGADAVVMLEHVTLAGEHVTLQPGRTVLSGENIVPRGAEAHDGDTLLWAGTRLGPAELALAASVGGAELEVYAQPVAAVLATGDELVEVDKQPSAMQIRNSNSHGLAALVARNGGEPRLLPPVADTREALDAALAAVRDADMLLLSGGVSAGKYDLVEEALLARGAEFFFTGVAMQPGKPAVFGRMPPSGAHREQWIFGLPGNPVSTQVTALLFAMPMLRALGGEGVAGRDAYTVPQPLFAQATLAESIDVRAGLTRFLPALLRSGLDGATVRTTGWQGSGDLYANARANCYLVVPPEASQVATGATVTVLLR